MQGNGIINCTADIIFLQAFDGLVSVWNSYAVLVEDGEAVVRYIRGFYGGVLEFFVVIFGVFSSGL